MLNRRDAIKGIAAVGAGLAGVSAFAESNSGIYIEEFALKHIVHCTLLDDGFELIRTFEHDGNTWQHFAKTVYKKSDAKDEENRIVVMDDNLTPFVCDCTVRAEEQCYVINGKKTKLRTVIAKGQTVEGYWFEDCLDFRDKASQEQPIRTTLSI